MYTISNFDSNSNNNKATNTNTNTIMDNPEVGINDLFKDAKEAWERYQKQELNPQQGGKASSSASSSNAQPPPPQQQQQLGSMLNPQWDAQAQPFAGLSAALSNDPAAAARAASRRRGDAPSEKRVSESSTSSSSAHESSASASNGQGQEPQAKSESKAPQPPPPPPPPRPLTKEEQANSILAMLLGKNNNAPTLDPQPFPTSLSDSDDISPEERRRREAIEESIRLKYHQAMNPTRELVWDAPTFNLDKDATAAKKTTSSSSSSSKKRKSPPPTYSYPRINTAYNQPPCGRAVIYTTCLSALPRPSSSDSYASAGLVENQEGSYTSRPKKLKPSLLNDTKELTKEEADTIINFANQYTQKTKKKKSASS